MPIRTYDPLPGDHPLVTDGERCVLCHSHFRPGDVTTLIPLPPSPEDEGKKVYTAVAIPAHAQCLKEKIK